MKYKCSDYSITDQKLLTYIKADFLFGDWESESLQCQSHLLLRVQESKINFVVWEGGVIYLSFSFSLSIIETLSNGGRVWAQVWGQKGVSCECVRCRSEQQLGWLHRLRGSTCCKFCKLLIGESWGRTDQGQTSGEMEEASPQTTKNFLFQVEID